MPEDYKYDVFLSYKRCPPVGPWVGKFFLPCFRGWLTEELGGVGARVFYDQEEIAAGERWPLKLVRALATSKLLISVCSPSYFRSPWCLLEWESFGLREQQLGCERLRIPIRHCDGKHFRDDATQIQMIDFSDCTSEMPAFVTNERALILEAKVKELAAHVATAIENVPAFRPGLPVALNKTLEDLSGVLGSLRGKRAYEGDHLDDVATGLLRLG